MKNKSEKKYILVKEEHSQGYDEMYAEWFRCSNCENSSISHGFNYCPDCGIKLRWSLKKE